MELGNIKLLSKFSNHGYESKSLRHLCSTPLKYQSSILKPDTSPKSKWIVKYLSYNLLRKTNLLYIVEKKCLSLEYIGDSMLPNSWTGAKVQNKDKNKTFRAQGKKRKHLNFKIENLRAQLYFRLIRNLTKKVADLPDGRLYLLQPYLQYPEPPLHKHKNELIKSQKQGYLPLHSTFNVVLTTLIKSITTVLGTTLHIY